ncbi:MAG: M61 family peptidase, partial [Gammaproteobacteria bacterium]
MPAYRIAFTALDSRLIDVEMRFASRPGEMLLNLPAWIPGSYMIRDFAKNIVSLHVEGQSHRP